MSRVLRCEACAAPLKRTGFVVVCAFCDTENRMEASTDPVEYSARMTAAAERSRRATADASRRSEALLAEYEVLAAKALRGDKEAGLRAVEKMEGHVRMLYVPTLILVNAMDPEDEATIDTLRQIDGVVEEVCRNTAEALGVEYIRPTPAS